RLLGTGNTPVTAGEGGVGLGERDLWGGGGGRGRIGTAGEQRTARGCRRSGRSYLPARPALPALSYSRVIGRTDVAARRIPNPTAMTEEISNQIGGIRASTPACHKARPAPARRTKKPMR